MTTNVKAVLQLADFVSAGLFARMTPKYPVKIQTIRSKGRTDRFYVFVPLPLAAAIGLQRGEEVHGLSRIRTRSACDASVRPPEPPLRPRQ